MGCFETLMGASCSTFVVCIRRRVGVLVVVEPSHTEWLFLIDG